MSKAVRLALEVRRNALRVELGRAEAAWRCAKVELEQAEKVMAMLGADINELSEELIKLNG